MEDDTTRRGAPRTSGGTVRQDGDRVWVAGVSGWFVDEKESSVHAAVEAVMRALGETVAYDDLVGVSGLAFRMQVSIGGLCPSSPHCMCGYQCIDRSSVVVPWAFRHYAVKPHETDRMAEVRRVVAASIDRGVPVQYGSEEDGVIYGYTRDGGEWLAFHALHDGGREPFVETEWPWGIAIYTERKTELPDPRAAGVAALRQAVAMAEAGEADRYYVGYAAWEDYIRQLEALERAEPSARAEAMQGNAWIYECLAQYRAVASRYLSGLVEGFDGVAAERLVHAATTYRRIADSVLRDADHPCHVVAPYPDWPEVGGDWPDDVRRAQIDRLRAALPLEREAVEAIRAALAAMNGTIAD